MERVGEGLHVILGEGMTKLTKDGRLHRGEAVISVISASELLARSMHDAGKWEPGGCGYEWKGAYWKMDGQERIGAGMVLCDKRWTVAL